MSVLRKYNPATQQWEILQGGVQGLQGPPVALSKGTVTTTPPGTNADFTVTGTPPNQKLNLTIPRGEKGDTGNPSDYVVVGPGRPDTAATTGFTQAQLNALPVGAEYRSTDGAGVGAWVWMKRPTGWTVTDGDTGWRVFAFEPEPWNGAVSVRIRRIGTTVYMEPHAPSNYGVWRLGSIDASSESTGSTVAFILDAGFRPANRVVAQITDGGDAGNGGSVGRVAVDGTNGLVRVRHPKHGALTMTAIWPTAQPWPTTLPGTPA